MKKNAIFTAISLALATGLIGCTSFVVNDPNEAAEEQMETSQEEAIGVPLTALAPTPKAAQECTQHTAMPSRHYINDNGKKVESIRIRSTGYGAPPKAFYPDPQRRLMAMRAAKIDAYRNLAERVNGIQIWGGTTVGDMVIEKDRFRVFLDTYLVGAKVIAENPNEDGTFETVVELKVGEQFLHTSLDKPASKGASDPCVESLQPTRQLLQSQRLSPKPGPLKSLRPDPDNSIAQSDFYFDKE